MLLLLLGISLRRKMTRKWSLWPHKLRSKDQGAHRRAGRREQEGHCGSAAAGPRAHPAGLAGPAATHRLHSGPRGLPPPREDRDPQERWCGPLLLPLSLWLHLPGVLPPPPQPLHPRDQRQCYTLPGLPAGRPDALEPEPDGGSCWGSRQLEDLRQRQEGGAGQTQPEGPQGSAG